MKTSMIYLPNVVTLRLDEDKCVGCGVCLDVCPQGALEKQNGKVRVARKDSCMECGACARNCQFDAISVDVGVGCAAAVINSVLGREGSCCCSLSNQDSAGASKPTTCADRSGCC